MQYPECNASLWPVRRPGDACTATRNENADFKIEHGASPSPADRFQLIDGCLLVIDAGADHVRRPRNGQHVADLARGLPRTRLGERILEPPPARLPARLA